MEKQSKTLYLNLKAKWYNLIESGVKTEEYREIKPFWLNRLLEKADDFQELDYIKHSKEDWKLTCEYFACLLSRPVNVPLGYIMDNFKFKEFDTVVFSYGYTKRRMSFKIDEILWSEGKPEWGAEDRKKYIVIRLGDRID